MRPSGVRVSRESQVTGGLFANFLSGAPLRKTFFNPYDGGYTNLRAPQGTEPGTANNVNAVSEFRLPDRLNLSARLQYDMHELIKQHVVLIADVFNLLNLSTATAIESRDVPTFAAVVARQTPFRFQLGLRYTY